MAHLHHYLDDFLILGAPDSEECAESLHKLLVRFESLKVPIAMDKLGRANSNTHISRNRAGHCCTNHPAPKNKIGRIEGAYPGMAGEEIL